MVSYWSQFLSILLWLSIFILECLSTRNSERKIQIQFIKRHPIDVRLAHIMSERRRISNFFGWNSITQKLFETNSHCKPSNSFHKCVTIIAQVFHDNRPYLRELCVMLLNQWKHIGFGWIECFHSKLFAKELCLPKPNERRKIAMWAHVWWHCRCSLNEKPIFIWRESSVGYRWFCYRSDNNTKCLRFRGKTPTISISGTFQTASRQSLAR